MRGKNIRYSAMEDKLQLANLLIMLQNFETLWNMYSVSEGLLYRDEVKKSAKKFLELFNKVSDKCPEVRNSEAIHINSKNSTEYIDALTNKIGTWANSDLVFPCQSTEIGIGDNEKSRFMLQPFFMCLSAYLSFKLKLEYMPVLCKSSGEGAYHENNVKWKGRFPWQICDQVNSKFIASLGESETVVIVGDVRRSQDLITYDVSPGCYRDKMVSYIERVRKIVLERWGIFDRFTGDGFICYFNNYLSQLNHDDLYNNVVDACIKIQRESKPFFEEWQQGLQKISHEKIGLSIGIDAGRMDFSDNRLIFAIGTPAVWATRMCSAGKAGDIIMNNVPHSRIYNSGMNYCFEEVFGEIKTGEEFKAFRLRYE